MEEVEKEVKKFKLPNRKVKVRLVDAPRGAINDKDHILYNMAPGSTYELCPRNKKNSTMVDCPLTNEEIDFFENNPRMAFNVGELSPFLPDDRNFWRTKRAKVQMDSNEKHLDLSDPQDYLTYKILLNNPDKVVEGIENEFSKKGLVYVIVSEEDERKKSTTKGDEAKRAWKLAGRMEDDADAMIDYLTVVGKRPPANSKKAFLIPEINKQVEENRTEFLEILEDPQYPTRLLITKSLQIKAVIRDNYKYSFEDGTELCNRGETNNLKNALNFLDADENQDLRLMLEAKVAE